MTGFSVKGNSTFGFEELTRALQIAKEKSRDMSESFQAVGERMLRFNKLDHFRDQKQRDGSAWPPLRESTLARRRKGKGSRSGKPLQDTGRMKASIASRFGSTWAEVGTNVEYAPAHQFGVDKTVTENVRAHARTLGKRVRASSLVREHSRSRHIRIPKREFIFVNASEQAVLVSFLTWHLLRDLKVKVNPPSP